MGMPVGRLPTIPEYWKEYMKKDTDLIQNPSQPCPFHQETRPSFSYARELGKWSCFGSCRAIGKDVIDMHMRYAHLNSRDEAEQSLRAICKCQVRKKITGVPERVIVNTNNVEYGNLLYKANSMANTVDRWLELDYVMSQSPIEPLRLKELIQSWESNV